jgi:four helix bundle protein
MNKVEKFEDLIAWQKARVLSREIYKVTRTTRFSKDWALVDQIRRATTSVMSNIAEGFERGSRAEFHQFLVVAKGSCGEVRSQLYIALDADYVGQAESKRLHDMATEVSKIIGGLKLVVRKQRDAAR